MGRLLLVVISVSFMVMTSPVGADTRSDQKAQVKTLYKNYRASLTEDDWALALIYAERMYDLTPEAYGLSSKTHATATFNLGQVHSVLNHHKIAADFFKIHLDLLDARQEPRDQKYLTKLGFLVKGYEKSFNSEQAFKYTRKELSLAKKLDLPDNDIGQYELKLGRIAIQLKSRMAMAIGHMKKAQKIFLKIHGENHMDTADAILWQARYHTQRLNPKKALIDYKKVMKIYQTILTPDDKRILQLHDTLGGLYSFIGDWTNRDKHHQLAAVLTLDIENRDLKPLVKVRALYPKKAMRKKLQGYVVVEFKVNKIGKVRDAIIFETTNKIFDKAAIQAVKKFRYQPAIKDGKLIEVAGVLEKISFTLPTK